MAKGDPDYTQRVKLLGVDDAGNLVTVLLDDAGRIQAIIQGAIEAITDNVTVEQDAKDREVQGQNGDGLITIAVDDAGRMISVLRDPVNDQYLSIDADGNIVSVMKGDFDGTLKTLAVDADGYLQAVNPDLENIWGKRVTIGNAELASRLGSPINYERRGDVTYFDTFANGLSQWTTLAPGTGAAIELTSDYFRSAGYAAKIITRSDTPYYNQLYHRDYVFHLNENFGMEWCFSFNSDVTAIEFLTTFNTDDYLVVFGFRYDPVNDTIDYYNSGGGWTTLQSDLVLNDELRTLKAAKLVMDMTNHKYLRLYFNHNEYDMSGIDPEVDADPGAPMYLQTRARIWGSTGVNAIAVLDSMILTTREPS